MDSNSTINRDYNFDFNIENNHENNINEELEIRWKEIEDITEQKLNKNRESKKLNFLNSFALMRINLNSLIHSVDDSEFQNYCNLKIRNLDNQLNSIQIKSNYNSNYNSNIIIFFIKQQKKSQRIIFSRTYKRQIYNYRISRCHCRTKCSKFFFLRQWQQESATMTKRLIK